jgi:hypothetical protein
MPKQQTQRVPKGGKNVERGVRLRARTISMRPHHIKRSRERHLKNALRSCGEKFAEQLRVHYAKIGMLNVPKKRERSHAK